MEKTPSYLPSASLHRPTFSTYMRANPFSKVKAIYLMDHQRRLADLGDRPYKRKIYPELPPHYPGTWCVYSWPEIETVVDRLYTIPRHWKVPKPQQVRNAVKSSTSFDSKRDPRSRISPDFRTKHSISPRPSDSISSLATLSSVRSSATYSVVRSSATYPNVRMSKPNQQRSSVTPRRARKLSTGTKESEKDVDNEDNVSITSKTYDLLQTISSTDGKIQPVFSNWYRNKSASVRTRSNTRGVRVVSTPALMDGSGQEVHVLKSTSPKNSLTFSDDCQEVEDTSCLTETSSETKNNQDLFTS
ncbi:uncharacterized protein LOC129926523 isoform X2 [Biomphalaria glabrata]|uniref:Uncharacterized protein LOC129926523 isoform X2 n=1 Tax=Biomphalaria glabrata TaxID=6526 RepID=A0A9W3AJ08_BIOGL|nr:uncharacterized protein LOC129926523 isoform X2 [Biomphalaria glabrata]